MVMMVWMVKSGSFALRRFDSYCLDHGFGVGVERTLDPYLTFSDEATWLLPTKVKIQKPAICIAV